LNSYSFPLDVNALLSVLNHLNQGVYVTDRERRIVLWNRKAEEITGYRAADIVGKACHQQVLCHTDKDGHPLCSTGLCPLFRAIRLGKESRHPVLVYARRADGSRVAVSVSVGPIRNQAGEVVGGIETFRDVTESISDLEFARKIQQYLLPPAPEPTGRLRFDVRYYPLDLVGGDFYDIRPLGEDRFGILVADVSGHGVSAALYTMWLKSLEETLSADAAEPDRFLSGINRELSRFVLAESFATAFYGVVSAGSDGCSLRYSNAGHPTPLHFHAARGEVTELEIHGMPLGIIGAQGYPAATASLEPGDLLLCYTDGVTEVIDRNGDMIGPEGLAARLTRGLAGPESHLLERLYTEIKEACGDVSLPDDVLLLSVRHQPGSRV